MEGRITMILKYLERLEVLNRIKEKPLKQGEGAQILDILGTGGFLIFWRLDFAPSVALRSSQPT